MKQDETLRREYLLKEIDVIQDIVKRMAHNSFLIKGWALGIVVGVLLLKGAKYQVLLAFIPLFALWFLDAYFLWQERMYRKLYEWVIEHRLQTNDYLFNLNPYRFKENVQSKPRIMFSITLGWFYGSIAVLTVIYGVALLCLKKEGG